MRFIGPLDRILYLRSVPLIGTLKPQQLEAFAARMTERAWDRGALLQRAGVSPEAVHIIVEGNVDAVVEGNRRRSFGPGDVVGGFDVLAGDARSDIVATAPTLTLDLRADALRLLLEDHFDAVLHVFSGMGQVLINDLRAGGPARLSRPRPSTPKTLLPEPDRIERMMIFRATIPFARVDVDALAQLARMCRPVAFVDGASLWQLGDQSDHVLVLLSGEVALTVEEGPPSVSFVAGEVVGFLDGLAGDRRWATARAVGATKALRLDIEPLFDVMEDNFDTCLQILGEFAAVGRSILERPEQEDLVAKSRTAQ